jgi:PAS domain S-box-containing protein
MKDEEKTKEQLINELVEIRRRIAELESSETERNQTEEKSLQSEKEKTIILDSIDDLVAYQDTDMKVLWVNRAAAESATSTPQELIGHRCYEIWHNRSEPCVGCPVILARETKQPQSTEMSTPDGRQWLVRGYPIINDNGGITGIVEITSNITEKKKTEEELLLRAKLLDNASDGICLFNLDGEYVYVNEMYCRSHGYTKEELLGTNIRQMDSAATEEWLTRLEDELHQTGLVVFESTHYRKDGSIIELEVRSTEIEVGDTRYNLSVERDITERKQAEEMFRILAKDSPVGVYIVQTGKFVYINPRFQELTGYSEDELLQMNPGDIVHPDERVKVRENTIKMLKGELHSPYEFQVLHHGGEPHWAMETVSSIEYNGKRATLGNFMDITESKLARQELEKLYNKERELRESLEEEIQKRIEFTRALVHELKTPITPVLAAVELLMEEMNDPHLARLVESIDRSANNLNQRIDELLDLARGETDMLQVDMEIVDTLSLFNDVGYEMIPLALRNKQILNFELPESLPSIEADRSRLRQIVMNLLSNAFKFTPEGGTVTLRASSDDESIYVEIEDTGPGINQEDLERLFEPYFRRTTDRERLSGFGLGLALAKNFVELHRGQIWVESKIGKGSIFHFILPIRQNNNQE